MTEKLEKKQDRRVLRTKRAIRNAFMKLLAEKEIEKITVKEVADSADVDRKTVYNYYGGVYEILDELENELAETFERAIAEFDFATGSVEEIFVRLSDLVKENLEVYDLLMKIDGNSRLISKIVVYLREKIRLVIGLNGLIPPEKIELAAEYVTAGIFSAYRHWFNSDRKQSLDEFTKDLSRLVLGGFSQYFLD